jgi:ABC-2 type transport system permease protein
MSMRASRYFSPARCWAIVVKEFVQMRRDRLTFAMMIAIPIIQLVLFGYAINANPRNLPTAVLLADNGPYGRTMLQAIKNSGYFALVRQVQSEAEADRALARGEVLYVVTIPENFSRNLVRGDRPVLLVEGDVTDPAVISYASGSLRAVVDGALHNDLKGPLAELAATPGPVELRQLGRYNPELVTQYNTVPGLMGVVLTLTMILLTGLAITRERERGTMENLLSMPTRPLEVLIGKILPYILVGYIQVALILLAAQYLFQVPMAGDLGLLLGLVFLFIVANLAVGITFSTIARNQLQAMQMTFFFFLPSMLLSGFMFPFVGMPAWAQVLGEILPLTHFLRIVRGIVLKGSGLEEVAPELWPIAVFATVALVIAVVRCRQTLD